MKRKMWTKDEIKKVAMLWESKTTDQLAKELGREKYHVQAIACQMRKAGFKLARKRQNGYLLTLLTEVKRELR